MNEMQSPSRGHPNNSSTDQLSKISDRCETRPVEKGRYGQDDSQTIEVKFTRQECRWLMKFLEERTKNANSEDGVEILDAVLSKLCDADTLAVWLRENTVVSLDPEEAGLSLETIKAVTHTTNADDSSSPEDIADKVAGKIASKLECVAKSC